jgi:hypothetical protein
MPQYNLVHFAPPPIDLLRYLAGFRQDEITVHDQMLRYWESIVGLVMGSVRRPQASLAVYFVRG